MRKFLGPGLLAVALTLAGQAMAGPVDIAVTDSSGAPLANAVVALIPVSTVDMLGVTPLQADAVIDQNSEQFIPLVTLLRRGGRIVFTNSDSTTHQVYSFSAIKQFQYVVNRGEKTPPVQFPENGIAAIGCNIHDHMVAFVYVTDNPLSIATKSDGIAHFAVVPNGGYRVQTWHPALSPRKDRPQISLTVTQAHAQATITVPVSSSAMPGMTNPHAQHY